MERTAFRFFYDQLPNDLHRIFYSQAEQAVYNGQTRLVCQHIPGLQPADYMRILEYVYDDHPDFLSFYPLRSQIHVQGVAVQVDLFYRYSREDNRRYEQGLAVKTQQILSRCFPNGYMAVSELEREKAIFDWITKNVIYDSRSLEDLEKNHVREYTDSSAWNAYGALVMEKAVCEGIACGFKHLCNCVGLPCIVVIGNVKGLGRHAWNQVRIHGKFYNVDCTWDLRASISLNIPYARYRYFNIPDRILASTHTPEAGFLPTCGSLQYNPFRIRGLVAKNREETLRLAEEQAARGLDRFAILCLARNAEETAPGTAARLSSVTGREVRYCTDQSGFFLGFEIDRNHGVIRL